MWSPETLIFITVVFLIAGVVKGVVGMGLPTVSVALLAILFTPTEAISLMLLPSLITNIWQALVGGHFLVLLRRLWTLLLLVCTGVWLGTVVLVGTDSGTISVCLGLILLIYGFVGLFLPQLPPPNKHELWLSPFIGLLNGILTGVTGTFVIPAIPYLQAMRMDRILLVQAMGILFTVSTVALAVALSGHNLLPEDLGIVSAVSLVTAAIGMACGQKIRKIISESIFRKSVLTSLSILGAYLCLRFFI